ncbi:DUF192 domain-containing protein [Wenzhouxiangella sp. XN24]|uniref:DUF192 domain-containing protein n=1 Tax=Wenzhouxiangella sp. XN24 TaxID=2713569 RepID=UPI001981FC22|nr:DUF192 domain-containing protein [Wenzhouxiangella sp. XN24]
MMRRYLFPALCVIALVLALHTMTLASGDTASAALERIAIQAGDGAQHEFDVQLADTPETRRRGLMHVTELAPDQGMLFDFEAPRRVGMWMKNTPLSLDMLFIRADGTIARIESCTRPYSAALIESGSVVRAVLEINCGRAAALGIEAGDRVVHRLFPPPG